jgi:NAD(P)-dependent dehydrogenase (short-subunit alcohol dehydrogenase family)
MRVDDRPTQQQTHPGAFALRGEKSIKDSCCILRADSDSIVLDRDEYALLSKRCGSGNDRKVAVMPHLKPGSAIIGTSSEQAIDPSAELYDYAQTKAATTNYVKSLAKQLAPKGIRVNAVAPGPIWTPLQVSGGATMEKLEKFGSMTPLGRAGQPAELGSIYVQLAAADASYATGQVYGSAGGSGQP